MANAFRYMARTTTCPDLVRRVLQTATLPNNTGAYAFLGSNQLTAKQAFAEILNDATREMVSKFPILGRSDVTLTLTAGQRHVFLPSTLRFNEVMGVFWGEDEGACLANMPIEQWSNLQVERVDQRYREDTYTASTPEAFAISEINLGSDQAALLFYPMPAVERTIRVRLRTLETKWTIADMNAAAATATVTAGAISALTLTKSGENYTSAPTVVITSQDENGSGATAEATISSGRIGSLTVTAPGAGFTTGNAIVYFSGGRATSVVPDDMMDIFEYCGAYRLQRRNSGGTGTKWMELREQFAALCSQRAIELGQSTGAMKTGYFGFEGYPRSGRENAFGALGNLSQEDNY